MTLKDIQIHIISVCVEMAFIIGMYHRILDNGKIYVQIRDERWPRTVYSNQLPRSFRTVFIVKQKTCNTKQVNISPAPHRSS